MKLTFICPLLIAPCLGQNFIVSQMSKQFVDMMTKYKSPSIDTARASSEANRFFTEIADYPAFVTVENQLANINPFTAADETERKQMMIKNSQDAYNAWVQFENSPNYASYTKYVKGHLKDFDIDQLVAKAQDLSATYGDKYTKALSKMRTDPQEKGMMSTWASVRQKFVSDIGLAPYVKGKFAKRQEPRENMGPYRDQQHHHPPHDYPYHEHGFHGAEDYPPRREGDPGLPHMRREEHGWPTRPEDGYGRPAPGQGQWGPGDRRPPPPPFRPGRGHVKRQDRRYDDRDRQHDYDHDRFDYPHRGHNEPGHDNAHDDRHAWDFF